MLVFVCVRGVCESAENVFHKSAWHSIELETSSLKHKHSFSHELNNKTSDCWKIGNIECFFPFDFESLFWDFNLFKHKKLRRSRDCALKFNFQVICVIRLSTMPLKRVLKTKNQIWRRNKSLNIVLQLTVNLDLWRRRVSFDTKVTQFGRNLFLISRCYFNVHLWSNICKSGRDFIQTLSLFKIKRLLSHIDERRTEFFCLSSNCWTLTVSMLQCCIKHSNAFYSLALHFVLSN